MAEQIKKIRTRFAPSPTGFLHVGGLRTALYAYLFAKQNGGDFILRIEDTDRARLVEGSEQNIIDTLQIFGIPQDEGPFRQSERLNIYKKYADEPKDKDLVYEDQGALRFKMNREGSTKFTDIIRGEIEIENKEQEDFVIMKSDGFPTYNFAHLVDDHDMKITHVIRGEEFIPSMPKYIALHQALVWQIPEYAHLPLLLNKQRAKLSKREGDVAVMDFLSKGYLVPALLNFVSLLGWHPSKSEQEMFGLQDLLEQFKLGDVQKAGAIFDLDKLDWFQHVWAVKLYEENNNPEQHPLFAKISEQFTEKYPNFDQQTLKTIWPHIIERAGSPQTMNELPDEFSFFFQEPVYEPNILVWKKSTPEQTKQALSELHNYLQRLDAAKWGNTELEEAIKQFITEQNLDNGSVLWPLRVALTGKEKSMGPFEILDALNQDGKREVALKRIIKAAQSVV